MSWNSRLRPWHRAAMKAANWRRSSLGTPSAPYKKSTCTMSGIVDCHKGSAPCVSRAKDALSSLSSPALTCKHRANLSRPRVQDLATCAFVKAVQCHFPVSRAMQGLTVAQEFSDPPGASIAYCTGTADWARPYLCSICGSDTDFLGAGAQPAQAQSDITETEVPLASEVPELKQVVQAHVCKGRK